MSARITVQVQVTDLGGGAPVSVNQPHARLPDGLRLQPRPRQATATGSLPPSSRATKWARSVPRLLSSLFLFLFARDHRPISSHRPPTRNGAFSHAYSLPGAHLDASSCFHSNAILAFPQEPRKHYVERKPHAQGTTMFFFLFSCMIKPFHDCAATS